MFRVEYDTIDLPRPLRGSGQRGLGSEFVPASTMGSAPEYGSPIGVLRELHQSDQAALLLNHTGHVIGMNALSEAQIGRTIALRAGRLVAASQNEDVRLQRLINTVLQKPSLAGAIDVTVLSSKVGQQFVVRGTRVAAADAGVLSPVRGLLTFTDILATPAPRAAMLRDLFGLTASESSVAMAIVNGQDARSIALEKNIAIDTVRSHLKAIFAKTNTRRQVALAVLITRLQSVLDLYN